MWGFQAGHRGGFEFCRVPFPRLLRHHLPPDGAELTIWSGRAGQGQLPVALSRTKLDREKGIPGRRLVIATDRHDPDHSRPVRSSDRLADIEAAAKTGWPATTLNKSGRGAVSPPGRASGRLGLFGLLADLGLTADVLDLDLAAPNRLADDFLALARLLA
jgi:hypothetical protein